MKIEFLQEFIEDLKSLENIKTLGRVLEKLFDSNFEFKQNRDDHRYKGVEDAWIRDISKGSTAYRCIFIKKGDKIYLYRAGTKKIEQNLVYPDLSQNTLGVTDFKVEIVKSMSEDMGDLLPSPDPNKLIEEILRFTHISLDEIWIVAPIVSQEIFHDTNHMGRFINRALENNTIITIITRPPIEQKDFSLFDELEEKEILILYNEKINTRLWYLTINKTALEPADFEGNYVDTAILAAGDFTIQGMGMSENTADNLNQLSYRLPYNKNIEFSGYCESLFRTSIEHSKYKQKILWQ